MDDKAFGAISIIDIKQNKKRLTFIGCFFYN